MELKETEKRLLEAVSHIVENDGFTKIASLIKPDAIRF